MSNSVSKETADELAAAIERELTRHLETIQQTGVVDYTASAQRMRIGREVRLSVGGSSETGQVVGLSDTGDCGFCSPAGMSMWLWLDRTVEEVNLVTCGGWKYHTVLGVFEGSVLKDNWRIETRSSRTGTNWPSCSSSSSVRRG